METYILRILLWAAKVLEEISVISFCSNRLQEIKVFENRKEHCGLKKDYRKLNWIAIAKAEKALDFISMKYFIHLDSLNFQKNKQILFKICKFLQFCCSLWQMIRYFGESFFSAVHDSFSTSARMWTLRFTDTFPVDCSFCQT